MIDQTTDISHTFNDYQEGSDISFIKSHLDKTHSWCGQTVLDVGDLLILAARRIDAGEHLILREVVVKNQKQCSNITLSQIPQMRSARIILVKRGMDTIIPSGKTEIKPGDILVLTQFLGIKVKSQVEFRSKPMIL